MKKTSLSQDIYAAAHTALEDDDNLIAKLFIQVEDSDMAHHWRNFLSMTDTLMQNVQSCNWDEFVSSLHATLPWLIMYDNNMYNGCLTSGQC